MLIETRTLPSGSGTELANPFLALGSVADRTGQQAGAALLIVQLLARERLIPLSDARKLIRLLAPGFTERSEVHLGATRYAAQGAM